MSTAGTLAYTLRCLVWTGDLVDRGKVPSFGQDLYIRLAAVSHVQKKSSLAKILLPITAFVLLIPFTALAMTYKYIGTRRKKKVQKRQMLQYLRSTDEAGDFHLLTSKTLLWQRTISLTPICLEREVLAKFTRECWKVPMKWPSRGLARVLGKALRNLETK